MKKTIRAIFLGSGKINSKHGDPFFISWTKEAIFFLVMVEDCSTSNETILDEK
jgi:hypothetical protein